MSQSAGPMARADRSEEHTSELQSPCNLVCRLLLEKKKKFECRAVARIAGAITPVFKIRSQAKLFLATYAAAADSSAVDAGGFSPGSVFFFNDTATTEIYTLSLHDALPI